MEQPMFVVTILSLLIAAGGLMYRRTRGHRELRLPFIVLIVVIAALGAASLAGCNLGGLTAPDAPPTATNVLPTAFTDRAGAAYVVVPAGGDVAAFRIMQMEVTNAQYRACVEAGACTVPQDYYGRCNFAVAGFAEHPVVCVFLRQAREYAAWVGGALPTEAQWLRACQGDDARMYPWGAAAPSATLANFGEYDRGTAPVGSYPAGASPYGALDMAGNAWEWVDEGSNPNAVVRGGAFGSDAPRVACGARDEAADDTIGGGLEQVGFRVVAPGP